MNNIQSNITIEHKHITSDIVQENVIVSGEVVLANSAPRWGSITGDIYSQVDLVDNISDTLSSLSSSFVKTDGNQIIDGVKTFTQTGLNQLNDVILSSIKDSSYIKYNSISSKFVNTTIFDGGNF